MDRIYPNPTIFIDDSEPDLNAENLNKITNGLSDLDKRVAEDLFTESLAVTESGEKGLDATVGKVLNDKITTLNEKLTFGTYNYNQQQFNFNWFDYQPGIYRLGTKEYISNPPKGDFAGVEYSNVLVIRAEGQDTQTRILFPFGTDRPICYRTGSSSSFPGAVWKEIAIK